MEYSGNIQGGPEASSSHRPDDGASAGEGDYLEVAGHGQFTATANAVSLAARVEAGKLIADGSALEEVGELASLRDRVLAGGATEVAVDEFEGRGKSGILGGSTEARYGVRIECPPESLSSVLLAIAKEKSADLTGATWRFPRDTERLREATADAARDARGDAAGLATALGIELGAPHRVLHHHWADDSSARPVRRKGKSLNLEDQYIRLAAERTVHAKVVLRYRMK